MTAILLILALAVSGLLGAAIVVLAVRSIADALVRRLERRAQVRLARHGAVTRAARIGRLKALARQPGGLRANRRRA